MMVNETVFNDIGIVKSVNPSRSGDDPDLRIVYSGGPLNGKVIMIPRK
jgi:hypothetical protein